MDDRRIMEELDCCHSDEDLRRPEMAALAQRMSTDPVLRARWNRLQRADQAIGRQMMTVEVPAGLADRILARIDSAAPLASESVVAAGEDARKPVDGVSVAPALPSRSRWTGRVLALAASLLLCVGLWSYWDSTRSVALDANNLPTEAARWHDLVEDGPWQLSAPDTGAFPLANLQAGVRVVGWTSAEEAVDHPAIGYLLAAPDGTRAVLFVSRVSAEGVESAPPVDPNSSTMGKAVAFWQSSDLLYVLVLDDGARYNDFVNATLPPIT